MVQTPTRLLVQNAAWAGEMLGRDRDYFSRLARAQQPSVLWIGCSDSRVPAETITHARPGELFVHRNIANVVETDDCNALSVVEYAITVLRVPHIVICGHENCGGIWAALQPVCDGAPFVDRRIAPLRALAESHRAELDRLADPNARVNRLAELNVIAQVRALASHPVFQARPAPVSLHGWIYGLRRGLLTELVSGQFS